MSTIRALLAAPCCLLLACPTDGPIDEGCDDGVEILGCDGQTELRIEVWGDSGDGLATPRDLAFNPERPGEVWTVNRDDDSVVIYFDAGTGEQTDDKLLDPARNHFMEEVSSIAMGAPGTFATCQESGNTYDGQTQPNLFMGPTLWSSDLDVFATSNPEAVEYLSDLWNVPPGFADLGSHLDMLHESPYCMGIAWSHDNVYWVFDGYDGALVRYDFHEDHGQGWDDHGDGVISRFVSGTVERVEDVPSHVEWDWDEFKLYVADTGHARIGSFDPSDATRGADLPRTEPATDHHAMDGGEWTTLVDGEDVGLEEPSGIALHDGLIFVTDHADGDIFAFSMDGALEGKLELDRPGLMGIDFDPEGHLWVVDGEASELVRVRPD